MIEVLSGAVFLLGTTTIFAAVLADKAQKDANNERCWRKSLQKEREEDGNYYKEQLRVACSQLPKYKIKECFCMSKGERYEIYKRHNGRLASSYFKISDHYKDFPVFRTLEEAIKKVESFKEHKLLKDETVWRSND